MWAWHHVNRTGIDDKSQPWPLFSHLAKILHGHIQDILVWKMLPDRDPDFVRHETENRKYGESGDDGGTRIEARQNETPFVGVE